MIIALGCDHTVFNIKENVKKFLESLNYEVIDCGSYNDVETHYPIYGSQVAKIVANNNADFGIVICDTGIGISNSANKIKGTRTVLTSNIFTAIKAREEYDANILALGGNIIGQGLMFEIIEKFINTEYLNNNNQIIKRIDSTIKFENYDNDILLDSEIVKWSRGDYCSGIDQPDISIPDNFYYKFQVKEKSDFSFLKNQEITTYNLPKNFVFGTNVELLKNNFDINKNSNYDFDSLNENYLITAKNQGINTIKISIEWDKFFLNDNFDINNELIEYYNNIFDKCISLDIKIFVSIYNYNLLKLLHNKYNLFNKNTIDLFLKYAKLAFDKFGDKINKWITFDDSYFLHINNDNDEKKCEILQTYHNMMVLHAKTVLLYKEMNLKGKIGIVHIFKSKYFLNLNKNFSFNDFSNINILFLQYMLDANYLGYYSDKTIKIISSLEQNCNFKLKVFKCELNAIKKASSLTDFLEISYYNNDNMLTNIDKKVKLSNDYLENLFKILYWVKNQYSNYNEIYITHNNVNISLNQDFIKNFKENQNLYLKWIYEDLIKINGLFFK